MNRTIEKIVSLCKQRGFVYQSSDIYGGFGAVYDYGPLGVELKNNIANYWWKEMTRNHENIVGLDIIFDGDEAGQDGQESAHAFSLCRRPRGRWRPTVTSRGSRPAGGTAASGRRAC